MTTGRTAARKVKRRYGYGIVDADGNPWWDECCVSEEPECLREMCKNLNDPMFREPHDKTQFRVVRLFWTSKKGKRR